MGAGGCDIIVGVRKKHCEILEKGKWIKADKAVRLPSCLVEGEFDDIIGVHVSDHFRHDGPTELKLSEIQAGYKKLQILINTGKVRIKSKRRVYLCDFCN